MQQSSLDGQSNKEYLQPLSYSPAVEQQIPDNNAETAYPYESDAISRSPPQRLPPAPPPKLPPDENSVEHGASPQGSDQQFSSSPSLQKNQYSSILDQDQSHYLRRVDPVKDHVTYSIPSSVWRQEQVPNPKVSTLSQPPAHNEPQRSDSFYWQSPQSSMHSTNDEEGDGATVNTTEDMTREQPASGAGDMRKDSDATAASSLLSHSTPGPYGASALGFGGPSDWEHFGDYEAEEIDDTDLYTRSKSPTRPPDKPETAELPGSNSSNTELNFDGLSLGIQGDTPLLTSPENLEPILSNEARRPDPIEASHSSEYTSNSIEYDNTPKDVLDDSQRAGEQQVHKAVEVEVTSPVSDLSRGVTFATDLDETIQAWSKASSAENLPDAELDQPGTERAKDLALVAKPSEQNLQPCTNGHIATRMENSDAMAALTVLEPHVNGLGLRTSTVTVDADSQVLPQGTPKQDSVSPSITAESQQPTFSDDISEEPSKSSQVNELPQNQPSLAANLGPSAKAKETDDPYAGLDAWGKASLNRYIAMLREESQAQSDRDKLNIFTVFTSRETRLRAVLYGAENGPVPDGVAAGPTGSIKRASTTAFNGASKALPALPNEESRQAGSHVNGHAREASKKLSTVAVLGTPESKPTSSQARDTSSPFPTGDTLATVESPTSVQYSPGGRPIVPRVTNVDRMSYTSEPEKLAVAAVDKCSSVEGPMGLLISSSVEHSDGQSAGDSISVYKPFNYSEGRSEAHNYAANRQSKRQSQFRPYAAKRTGSDEYREMFLIDQPNIESTTLADETARPIITPNQEADPDLRRFVRADFDPLLSVLPESGDIHPKSVQLLELKQQIDAVPDDFSFIHQSVVAWDIKARRQREISERERHVRQVESEQKIDALFDDHEIGYGDISELESGFKRSEAARKADEDRSEYKTFVNEVFGVVWARLHYEIDQLSPLYTEHTKILNDTTAGKDMFDTSGIRFALAPTMDSLLALHQKLEIRYQKAFEAVLERDRRLKKTELSPWYSLGSVSKVKQLEKQFEDAEKKAIVEYCRHRDIRANNLMDVLDQNTLRGVGANQDYMEMVMKAVRRIASGRAFASQPGAGDPGVGLEEVTKAKSVTKALATSSEQIVQTFHVADMLLNAADYELSVAKAKLSGADAKTFQTLKEERAKEDQKLMRDLEHRLALIREDSRRTHDEIVKLLLFLGVQSGHAGSSAAVLPPTNVHEERLQRALEEAKQRNALKDSGGATVGPLN